MYRDHLDVMTDPHSLRPWLAQRSALASSAGTRLVIVAAITVLLWAAVWWAASP